MSDVNGELARARDAFERPTLSLLNSKWAPMRVAIFRCAFSRDRRTVLAERLHAQVDAYLGELAFAGIELPGSANGRGLCVQWMRDQWLVRTLGAEGEEYSLTSHALEALDLVQGLLRERALISESRLNTILTSARRCALEASPNADERITRLNSEIDELTRERDRLQAGGDVSAASEERMLEAYLDLVDLVDQLPSDFKRVEESVATMHRKIMTDLRDRDLAVVAVLDGYFDETDRLLMATPEGRAYEGAFDLLRDEALLTDLRENLRTIMAHPFSAALTPAEAHEFLGATLVIRRGIDDVLTQRHRVSTTLRDHIVNHDVIKEAELDQMLRDLERELAVWMRTARPRTAVQLALLPDAVDITGVKQRFYDPSSAAPPPPLEDVSDDAPDSLSLEEIRKQGGPSLAELRGSLIAAYASGDMESVGQMFNDLPDALRRPVEVLGLLHILADAGSLDQATTLERFAAIRSDGSRREFVAPRLTVTDDAATHIAARQEERS